MESVLKMTDTGQWFSPHERIRTEAYVLQAALLGRPPMADLLATLTGLQWEQTVAPQMAQALPALQEAARDQRPDMLEAEYNRLFVGLGCGELVPYASWYRDGAVPGASLASLRADLMRLGIVRQAENRETEDHVAALCEIMALISGEPEKVPVSAQAKFFEDHVASWMTGFFRDLRMAKNARFYRAVGLFGGAFLAVEKEYLRGSKNVH